MGRLERSADAISEDRRSSLPLFSIPPHKGDRIQFIPVLPSSEIVFATEPLVGRPAGTERCECAGTPPARPYHGVRPSILTQEDEHPSGVPAPAPERRPVSIRSQGV